MTTPHHTMAPIERVQAALVGEHVDRVPFCFWHHFKPEGSGTRMAELTMEFFREKFDLDIAKIMPDLPYPAPEQTITLANQWSSLPGLGLDTPMFQQQLICIRMLRAQLGKDFPLILTIFSPLTQIFRFIGKTQAIAHARENPVAFEHTLNARPATSFKRWQTRSKGLIRQSYPPILLIHGVKDSSIPIAHAYQIVAQAHAYNIAMETYFVDEA